MQVGIDKREEWKLVDRVGNYPRRIPEPPVIWKVKSSLAREYRLAPSSTATRLYLETLEEVLPRLDINLVDPGSGPVEIDLLRRDGPGPAPR